MSIVNAATLRVVLYEGSGASKLDDQHRAELVEALLDDGQHVTCTGPNASVSPADNSPVLVIGQFEQVPGDGEDNGVTVTFRDIAGLSTDQVTTLVGDIRTDTLGERKSWKPWFPVIDYDRCTNCMQCLSFCLFDVYGVDSNETITVQKNDNCKTDCPACSRVCPEVAIMFPKYNGGPINGDVVKEEDMQREAMKVDISSLLGGDIYAALRDRSTEAKQRFSKERDEQRAIRERKRCLKKLREKLDIPQEVIDALPSMDMIQAKAQKFMTDPRD